MTHEPNNTTHELEQNPTNMAQKPNTAAHRQTTHTYPSFMLFDLKAQELNLTQEQIETLVAQSKPFVRTIFDLYYRKGFDQRYIADELDIATSSVNYQLQQLKMRVQKLAQFWNNTITLIVGRSGTGKSTLEERLSEVYGSKPLRSYTTRPKRHENEDDHIFITQEQVRDYPNKVASTAINGHLYFATQEQLDASHTYVIDPYGLYELVTNCPPDRMFNLIYLKVSQKQHKAYLEARRLTSNETEESQAERLKDENFQFDRFEEIIAANKLPENITVLRPTDLLPTYSRHKNNPAL